MSKHKHIPAGEASGMEFEFSQEFPGEDQFVFEMEDEDEGVWLDLE